MPQRLSILASLALTLACNPHQSLASEPGRTLIWRCQPVYPYVAREMHVDGIVRLQVAIEPDGHVSRATSESGPTILANAAERAVLRWRYSPSLSESTAEVIVDFTR